LVSAKKYVVTFNINFKMDNDTVLYVTNIISIVLFFISEILGMSTCSYNGVFHCILGGFSCGRNKIYVDVSSTPLESQ